MLRRGRILRNLVVDTETHRVAANKTVAVVTFNTPTTRNALTVAMGDQFTAAMNQLRDRADVRAVVLTGAGQAFSAGGDAAFLAARLKDSHDGNIMAMRDFYAKYLSIRTVGVPTIAAINGPAIGAGLCVALACDVRIVAADAKLAVNFTRLGIHPGMGATYFLPRLIGVSQASRLLIGGEMISGSDARSIGIASQVVEKSGDVLPAAVEFAKTLCTATSRIAVEEVVRTLRQDDETLLNAALEREALAQATCYAQGADLAEALAALKEKRSPTFA